MLKKNKKLDSKKEKKIKEPKIKKHKEPKIKIQKNNKSSSEKESWFKGYGQSVEAEFASRIASSKKRIIKFIGLCLIPVLYAVTCIVAFWNPIVNIGKANVTFLDQEQSLLLATNEDVANLDQFKVWSSSKQSLKDDNQVAFFSTLLDKDESGNPDPYSQNNSYTLNDKEILNNRIGSWVNDNSNDDFAVSANIDYSDALGLEKLSEKNKDLFKVISKADIKNVYCVPGFKLLLMLGVIHESNPGTTDFENETFYTDKISTQKIALTNIHYQKWSNKGADTWKSSDSNVQIKINKNFFRGIVDVANFYFNGIQHIESTSTSDVMAKLKDIITLIANSKEITRITSNSLNVWTTFARNFIFGYYANTLNEFKGAIGSNIVEKLVSTISNSKLPVVQIIVKTFRDYGISDILNIKNIVKVEIQGAENGIYGIGLGEFFLLIGLYVGSLINTFVYDRAKRGGAKITKTQWYASKWTLLIATGFVQVTVLLFAVTLAGWYELGVVRLLKLYGVLLLTDLVFKSTIQAIWFSFKDETIGKFICVVYMVLNLSSGWGTFPSWMQFGFFDAVSHITEFKYSLQLIGVAVYGGENSSDILYAFKQVGFLLLIMAVFISIGLSTSILRNREMHFGSYRKKFVIEGLKALNNEDLANNLKENGWKALPNNEVMDDLVQWMRINHPFEGQFKWFKNKNYDRPIKPNYTDDDIMTRNDDVLV